MPRKYSPGVPNPRNIGKSPVQNQSAGHIALCFAKVVKRPVTIQQLKSFNPVKFASTGPRDLDKLVAKGFMIRDGNLFTITTSGIKAIYETANHTRLKHGNRPIEDE